METKDVLNQAVGVDISKDNFSSCLGVLRVDISKEFEHGVDLPNSKQGFSKFVKWVKKVRVKNRSLIIVLERINFDSSTNL